MRSQIEFLSLLTLSKEEAPLRLLGHHVFGKKRSVGAMDLETCMRMSDRERVVELRQQAASETDNTHDSIFERALSEALLLR